MNRRREGDGRARGHLHRSKSPPERHSRRSVGKLGSRDSRFRLADDRSRGDNTGQLVKDPLAVDVLPATKVRFSTVP